MAVYTCQTEIKYYISLFVKKEYFLALQMRSFGTLILIYFFKYGTIVRSSALSSGHSDPDPIAQCFRINNLFNKIVVETTKAKLIQYKQNVILTIFTFYFLEVFWHVIFSIEFVDISPIERLDQFSTNSGQSGNVSDL